MTAKTIYTLGFLLSGAAGLIYQIVWIRQFSLVFGNTTYAVSMVVAGFMAGLALGSYYWGKRADAMKRPLLTYVRLEIAIAIAAFLVSGLIVAIDDVIVGLMSVESVATGGGWQLFRFVALFVILLAPTTLMGGTLPVMSRFYVRGFDQVGVGIGSLYAANTYGAVAGCFLAGYLLIPGLGVWGALITGFALNLLVAALVWSAPSSPVEQEVIVAKKKSTPKGKKKKKEVLKNDTSYTTRGIPLGVALSLGTVAGFCALGFEILWARAFVVSFKATVYLFSNLLAVYLLGMAIGSHVFSKWIDSIKDPLRFFGFAQLGIGVWGFLSVLLILKTPAMATEIGNALGEMSLTKDVVVMLLLMTVVMGVPTFLMGLSYPLVCRATTESYESLGKYAGLVYALGTVGGIAGTLLAGFFLLPAFGLQTSLFVISGLCLIVGYVALLSGQSRKGVFWVFPATIAWAFAVTGGVVITGSDIGLGRDIKGNVIFSREGITGSVRVMQQKKDGPLTLLVNNYQLATSGDVAVRFGHTPLIIKPDAKDVLLISLGSGITAGAVSGHPVERIDCVEIVPSLIDVQPLFKTENRNVLADKRFHLTFWDGRHYVRVSKRKYDLVISDLFQPDSAGVGNLYSLEHFNNVKAKLKKGGAMAQWLPLYQLAEEDLKVIMKTFAEAFEHVLVFSGDINSELPALMLMGSSDPIKIDPGKMMTAMERPLVKEDMIESTDPLSFLSFYVTDRSGVLDFTKGSLINTDNRPVIEYNAPKNIWTRRENAVRNFSSIAKIRKKIDLPSIGAEGDATMDLALGRYFKGRQLLLRGKVEHAMQNYPAELATYKQAARLIGGDPFLGLATFDLGYIYYHRGDFRTAASVFDMSKRINVNLLETHFYLGKSYLALGMKKEALEAFQELEKLNPEIVEALVGR